MIFDFKDQLGLSAWDESNLVFTPPKAFRDYLISTKIFFKHNINLTFPFLLVAFIFCALNYYSYKLSADILIFEDDHISYQDKRSSILLAKQDLSEINTFIATLSPFISDSIYPNLFLSYLSPIVSSDSSISELVLNKDSATLRLSSTNTDLLSSSFSTLDQHPLINDSGITFTSIKSSADSQQRGLNTSTPNSITNEIEIKFTYNFVPILELIRLFDKSGSLPMHAKASYFK